MYVVADEGEGTFFAIRMVWPHRSIDHGWLERVVRMRRNLCSLDASVRGDSRTADTADGDADDPLTQPLFFFFFFFFLTLPQIASGSQVFIPLDC